MSDAAGDKLIVILGSGPGIGVGVASHFASQSFGRVALISRNAERLKEDAETVKANSRRTGLQVKIYAVDVVDVLALEKTLKEVAHDLGPPEVIVYNAARLRQSKFGEVPARDLTEDFQVCFIFPGYGRCALCTTIISVPILRLHTTCSRSLSLVSIPRRCGQCHTYQLSLRISDTMSIRHSWSQAVGCTRIQCLNSSRWR